MDPDPKHLLSLIQSKMNPIHICYSPSVYFILYQYLLLQVSVDMSPTQRLTVYSCCILSTGGADRTSPTWGFSSRCATLSLIVLHSCFLFAFFRMSLSLIGTPLPSPVLFPSSRPSFLYFPSIPFVTCLPLFLLPLFPISYFFYLFYLFFFSFCSHGSYFCSCHCIPDDYNQELAMPSPYRYLSFPRAFLTHPCHVFSS